MKKTSINRRQFLQGTLASSIFASTMTSSLFWTRSAIAADADTKVIFMYSPQGAIPEYWHPTGSETDFTFPIMSAPLEAVKQHCLFMNNLKLESAGHNPNYRIMGKGTTVDLVLANTIGKTTPYSLLNLGVLNGDQVMTREKWKKTSDCESNPINAFQRLFSSAPVSDIETARKKSVLDYQLAEINKLASKLGKAEQSRLEQHADSIRTIEKRLMSNDNMESEGQCAGGGFNTAGFNGDAEDAANFDIIFDLQTDLIVLAMQCGLTRVTSFMMNNTGANIFIPNIGAEAEYHASIHSGKSKYERYATYRRYFSQKQAEFIAKLANAQDVDGNSLLDNTILLHITDTGDGRSHDSDSPPFYLAGGSKKLKTGRSLSIPGVNCLDLLDTVAYAAGVDIEAPEYDMYGSGPVSQILA